MNKYKEFNDKAENILKDWDKINATDSDRIGKILDKSWRLIREMLETIKEQEK